MTDLKKVYVILINYNSWEDTIECLQSLINVNCKPINIIVIDNASKDDSIQNIVQWAEGNRQAKTENNDLLENIIIDKRPPILFSVLNENQLDDDYDVNNEMEKEGQLIIIKSKKNRGFSGGNNLGLTFASQKRDCKYLWILNNDTVVDKNSVSSKIKYLEDQGDSILLGTRILDYYKPKNIQSYGGLINKYFATTKHFGENMDKETKFPQNYFPDYIPGTSIFFEKKVLNKIGFMPEDYFMYYEDVDWSLKAVKSGIELRICPDSIIWHKEGASQKDEKQNKQKPKKSDVLSVVNKLILAKRYFPRSVIFVYLGIIKSLFRMLLYMQSNRAIEVIKRIL